MENKVIINLDEYLELRDKVKKIDKLKYVIKEDIGMTSLEYRDYSYNKRQIIISKLNLKNYLNDILDVSGYGVYITEDEKYN